MIAPNNLGNNWCWCEFWTYNTRKLFRDQVRPLISYWKTMREFGECVKG